MSLPTTSTPVGQLPGKLTACALSLPDTLSFEDWERAGQTLLRMAKVSQWAIGDWLAYGKWRYGERYRAVLEILERDYSEVAYLASVAGRVPPAIREPSLSWTHHRLVAKLIPRDQERWLKRAKAEGWSSRELAEELGRASKLSAGEEPAPVLEQLRLTVDPDRRTRYQAAAERVGSDFNAWAIAVLDAEAAKSETS